MSRSIKKGPYVDAKLALKVEKQNQAGSRNPIKTWARACTIAPEFVGHTFEVHNGRAHIKCAAKDKRKAQDIIDLIGKVAAACSDDRIRRCGARQFGHNFGCRVGQRKNNRLSRHVAHHIRA